MPWSHRTWFGSIVVSNEIRTVNIFDTFLNLETEIKLEADVLDICNTHNFIIFVTKEALFIFRVDNVMIPMRCVLSPTVFDFKFQPAKWDRVIQKKLKAEIAKDVEKPKRKSHNLLLTATVSTAYLICTLDDRSTVIRMFHEPFYIDSGCIEPRIVQKPVEMKIVMATSGNDHSLFLSSNGEVYALGTGSRGELGVGVMTRTDELIWIEAMEGLHTTHISAGAWHSVALTEAADVYVWGWNHMGQLGSDKSETELYPSPLELDESAVMIAAQGNKTFLWLVEESEENMVVMGSEKCGKPASDTTLTL